MGKALDDGHQRQPAGAARTEQGQDVEGRHGAQLIAEQHHAVLEPAVMLVRHGEQLTGEVLDHKSRDEVLGGVFLRQNEKNGALLRGEHLRVDGAVVADDLLQLRVQEGVQAGEDGDDHGEEKQANRGKEPDQPIMGLVTLQFYIPLPIRF